MLSYLNLDLIGTFIRYFDHLEKVKVIHLEGGEREKKKRKFHADFNK